MKKIFLVSAAMMPFIAYAQQGRVGINTAMPNATLEVKANAADPATADGVIPPQLTRAQLIAKTAYGTSQKGAMVYVTDLSGTVGAPTVNVDKLGYYYWDGTAWQKVAGDDWNLTGNVGNDNQFLGTTTNKPIVFKVNNTEFARLDYFLGFSLGRNNQLVNSFSPDYDRFAIGHDTKSVGAGSIVLSNRFGVAESSLTTAFGTANTLSTVVSASITGAQGQLYGQNRLLVVGNGFPAGVNFTDNTNRSDALTILYNGMTGIGIDNFERTNSDAILQLNGKVLVGNFGNSNGGTTTISTAGAANADLDVRGSVSFSVRSFSGTVGDSDYTVIGTGDVSLPDPTTRKGRVYKFVFDGTPYTINGLLRWNGGDYNSYGLNSGNAVKGITVQSNGTRWQVIGSLYGF